jgi:CAAD domains of cyanobacterial aminoacyl-tRNA synthetase
MNTEIVQQTEHGAVIVDENGDVEAAAYNTDLSPDTETLVTYDGSTAEEVTDTAGDTLSEIQVKVIRFFEKLPDDASAFFNNNRQAFNTLGLILLGFLGLRVLFAVLDAIDDIPLMAFFLKVTGLVYLTQFAWRYLMRANDREQLARKIEQFKNDLLGNRSQTY